METLVAEGTASSIYETDRLDSPYLEAFTIDNLLVPVKAWIRIAAEETADSVLELNFPLDCNTALAVFGAVDQINDAAAKVIQYAKEHSLELPKDDLSDQDAIDSIVVARALDDVYVLMFGGYYEDSTSQIEFVKSLGLDYLEFGAQMDDHTVFTAMFDGGAGETHISDEMLAKLKPFEDSTYNEEFMIYRVVRFTEGTSDKIYGFGELDNKIINFWGKAEGDSKLQFKGGDYGEAVKNVLDKMKKGYVTVFATPAMRLALWNRMPNE